MIVRSTDGTSSSTRPKPVAFTLTPWRTSRSSAAQAFGVQAEVVDAHARERPQALLDRRQLAPVDVDLGVPAGQLVHAAGERLVELAPAAVQVEPDAPTPARSSATISSSEAVGGSCVTPTNPGPSRASASSEVGLVERLERARDHRAAGDAERCRMRAR